MRRFRAILAVGLAAALLTGCIAGPTPPGGVDPDDDGRQSLPAQVVEIEAPALTASQTLAQMIAEEIAATGQVSIQHVVDAVDLTFIDMPGATSTTLEPGEGLGGSYVLSLLRDRLDELTPEQRAVAERVLFGAPSPRGTDAWEGPTDPSVTGASTASLVRPTLTQDDFLKQLAGAVLKDWRTKLPGFPAFLLDVFRSDEVFTDHRVFDAGLIAASFTCQIRYYPAEFAAMVFTDFRGALAHELFHCYQQFVQLGPLPDWVIEGGADWAAMWLYRDRGIIGPLFTPVTWFTQPGTPLEARAYDAWALFRAFEQDGGNVWNAMNTLLQMNPFPEASVALTRAGITSPRGSLAWARLSTRQAGFPDWLLAWPHAGAGVTSQVARADVGVGPISITAPDTISHQAVVLKLDTKVNLLVLQAGESGFVTRVDAGTVTVPERETIRFCAREDLCVCPDGSPPPNTFMKSDFEIVVAFDPMRPGKTALGEARTWNPKVECEQKPKPVGYSNGDPHLQSYDGYAFDIMSLGEFVNTRDPRGGFEVQTRHELYGENDLPGGLGAVGAAVGTSAVAIEMDDTRVTFTSDSFSGEPGDVVIRVDGKKVSVPTGSDDVTIEPGSRDGRTIWTVTGEDGSSVELLWWAGFFATARPTVERAGRAVGLLGSMDGNAGNDLLLPDGTPLGIDESLEDVYAQAWLVTDQTSLFDYEEGQSSEYFHLPLPPLSATIDGLLDFFNSMNGIPPTDEAGAALDECEDTLGPQATRFEVRSCVYDVSATGDDGFFGVYASETEIRLEGEEFDWLWDMFMPGREPKPGVTEPKAGEPSLVLDAATPAGTVRLPEGAVVTFRTDACADGLVRVDSEAYEGDEIEDTVALCADDPTNSLFGLGSMVDGEAYGVATDAGAYVFSFDPEYAPAGTTIEITVDTEPTTVTNRLSASRYSGRVRELGDAEVFLVSNPGGGSFSQTGIDDDACVLILATFQPLGEGTGFHAIPPDCIQGATFSVLPTFDGLPPVALIVVARTDEPTRFTLKRG